jgi:hypothetical protein
LPKGRLRLARQLETLFLRKEVGVDSVKFITTLVIARVAPSNRSCRRRMDA